MADNRKYYYLKLKESYFDDDAIVLLESMPDGILYSRAPAGLWASAGKGSPHRSCRGGGRGYPHRRADRCCGGHHHQPCVRRGVQLGREKP